MRDLDRSTRPCSEKERFRDGPKMVFLDTPGSADTITLNEDPAEADVAGVNAGVAHFGFHPQDRSDLDAAIAEVEAAGGTLLRRGEHKPGIPYAYVTDPDGYVIEL